MPQYKGRPFPAPQLTAPSIEVMQKVPPKVKIPTAHSIRLPWRNVVLALTLLFPGTGGCSKVDVAEWREEVELANSEIVVVKRSEVRDKSGFPTSKRGVTRERRVVFPGGQPVWVSDGNMYAVALEIRDSKAYVAVNIRSRELCNKFGDPPSSMIFYRWDGASNDTHVPLAI